MNHCNCAICRRYAYMKGFNGFNPPLKEFAKEVMAIDRNFSKVDIISFYESGEYTCKSLEDYADGLFYIDGKAIAELLKRWSTITKEKDDAKRLAMRKEFKEYTDKEEILYQERKKNQVRVES